VLLKTRDTSRKLGSGEILVVSYQAIWHYIQGDEMYELAPHPPGTHKTDLPEGMINHSTRTP